MDLIEAGADVNALDDKGNTLLFRVLRSGRPPEVVRVANYLIQRASLETLNRPSVVEGYTPLHEAVEANYASVVKALLDRGADFLAVDKNGKTPAELASSGEMRLVFSKHPRVAEGRRPQGDAAIFRAIYEDNTVQVRKILSDNPAAADATTVLDAKTGLTRSAVEYAVGRGCNETLVGLLLNASKADINKLYNHHTLLMLAVRQSRVDLVKLLLDKDADARIQSTEPGAGYTALHYAVYEAGSPIIRMLLDKWPDAIAVRTREGTSVKEPWVPPLKLSNVNTLIERSIGHGKFFRQMVDAAPRLPGFRLCPYQSIDIEESTDTAVRSAVFPIHSTTIPKGTLLFRGLNSKTQLIDDFLGTTRKDNAQMVHCLSPTYGVYFYPFPFIDETVGDYSVYAIYVLTTDIEVAAFISPGMFARADRSIDNLPLTSCSNLPRYCGNNGRAYDPCLSLGFMKEYPDVVGMLGIAGIDRNELIDNLKQKPGNTLVDSINTYFGVYQDTHSLTPGVPELVLYPRRTRGVKEITGTPAIYMVSDFYKWFADHETEYIYKPYRVFGTRDTSIIKRFLDERFADQSIQLDATTGFFVDTDLADPAYYPNLVPAGPNAIADLDPARLRFPKVTLRPPRVRAPAPAPAPGTNAAGGP